MRFRKVICEDKDILFFPIRRCGFIYLYNKGMFRDLENFFVVSHSLIGGSNPKDRINKPFKTKREALNYIKEIKQIF
jgi:hypothetical protein